MFYHTSGRLLFGVSCLAILLSGILTACAPSTTPPRSIDRPCDWLREAHLQALPFGAMTMEEFENWIRDNYGIAQVEYNNAHPEEVRRTLWQAGEKKYAANFYEERLIRIDIYWKEPFPTAKSFIDCFSVPDSYHVLYQQEIEARSLSLTLWYPKFGIETSIYLLCRANCPPSIDEQSGLSLMSFFASGESVEDVLPFLYSSPVARRNLLETLHPWPGNWSAIVVDEQPKLQ